MKVDRTVDYIYNTISCYHSPIFVNSRGVVDEALALGLKSILN